MNPDNPTFRTPEEAARAKEYVRLTEENARLRAALEQIRDTPFCSYDKTGGGPYGTGVTDGHRLASAWAREALKGE